MAKLYLTWLELFIYEYYCCDFYDYCRANISPAQGVIVELAKPTKVETISVADQIVGILTVPDFAKLLSRENMLALIFSLF